MGEINSNIFDGVTLSEVKKIVNPKGDIFHALKASDSSFTKFGEAYFTTIVENEIKGWKKHNKMILNMVVPVGEVVFYIHDEKIKKTKQVIIGNSKYSRLTIKSGYWVAFEGKSMGLNLILNVASIEHDPDESINKTLDAFPLN